MTEDGRPYLTTPRLAGISWLVHGFGDAGWSEAGFMEFAASRGLRPVIMRQLHSETVHRLDGVPAGKLEGDALMTNIPGLLLVIRTADCLPVFLVDLKNRAVAAVHCGWRGTQKRILERAAQAMQQAYGSDPDDLLAALGPCIGPACYEVGPEVRAPFLRAGFPASILSECPGGRGKYLLDLRAANVWLLGGLGLKKDRILDSGSPCTHCELSLLSYRRDPAETRRMYNFIGLMQS
jgi:YfiH family protein